MKLLQSLKADFNNRIGFRQRRPGVFQVLAPMFHEDGDMIDMFIDLPRGTEPLRVSDHGLTLMRLSYNCDVETPSRRKVLDRILSESGVSDDRGRLYIETTPEGLYPSLLQLFQTIAKVSNISAFNKEVVKNLFFETLGDFVTSTLSKYKPIADFLPMPDRNEWEVDWCFPMHPRKLFLFGVTGKERAHLAALTCLELQRSQISFRSIVVHDDFDSLEKKTKARITNVADKQFVSLPDFIQTAEPYFAREVESTQIN